MTQFIETPRNGDTCWAHPTKPVWVVHYKATGARGAYFQGYVADGFGPRGRHPCHGGRNNRRVGHPDFGFKTRDEAEAACLEAC